MPIDSRKPSTHGPLEDAIRDKAVGIGKLIHGALPPGWGYALLVFKLDAPGRMNYISNAQREDMIKGLKELVASMEEEAHG